MSALSCLNGGLLYRIFTVFISSAALLDYNLSRAEEKSELLSGFSQEILSRCQQQGTAKAERIRTLLIVAEIILFSALQHGLLSPLNNWASSIFGTGTNYFGMIIALPILLPISCWILGIDPFKQIDLITPAFPLALIFIKLGCFFAGCCNGIVCTLGSNGQFFEVPVQIIESLVGLGLFLFFLRYGKKLPEGSLFPTYILLYSAIRFFTEFLRAEPNVLWYLKTYHLLCLFGVFYGTVQLWILREYKTLLSRVFSKNLPYLLFSTSKK